MQFQSKGYISRIVFASKENDFCILNVRTDTGDLLTVKGPLERPYVGQQLSIFGKQVKHPVYGLQCDAESIIPHIPYTHADLMTFLGSGRVYGIGPALAKRMADHFKDELVIIFREEHFERLAVVDGISEKRALMVRESWESQRAVTDIMVFLQARGISIAYGMRIYRAYGKEALKLLTTNPYELIGQVHGIAFALLDIIGKKAEIVDHDPRRLRAAMLQVLLNHESNGHVYIKKDALLAQASTLSGVHDLDAILSALCADDILLAIEENEEVYVAHKKYALYERELAAWFGGRVKKQGAFVVDGAVVDTCVQNNKLHVLQADAVKGAFSASVSVITGGPGTGKTTTIKTIASIAKKAGLKILYAAPTGRAAKRISENTGERAVTIHRLLEWDVQTKSFSRNAKRTLQAHVLVVDEASMIDLELMVNVVRALDDRTHLVLVGDMHQLPSVDKGAVLRDVIESGCVQTTQLTHVFRQAEGSEIVMNAQKINSGKWPAMQQTGDFVFISESDSAKFMDHVRSVVEKSVSVRGIAFDKMQIIVPMYRGKAGGNDVNKAMQRLYNTAYTEGMPFAVGDRVIQLANNYEYDVFNGDIGSVVLVDEEGILTVDFGDKKIRYEKNRLHELTLAYAITVHKSQGSEFDVVIIPLFMEHFIMLHRCLLYTAVTRAKKLCVVIGEKRALACAVKKLNETKRCTFLAQGIQKFSYS